MKRREAIRLRAVVELAAQSLEDTTALTAVVLYPEWTAGTDYTAAAGRGVGFKVRRSGKLWRLRQEHTAQAGWEPENAPALWEQICESHQGTLEDPIPYAGGMALENGRYYVQTDVVYLCIRDTGNPVYHDLADLVELYVAVARENTSQEAVT